jgi:uncharacterized repeat protein (TIGR03803 family)
VLYKISKDGAFQLVYSFCTQPYCADGSAPSGGLTVGANGNLYGSTISGGYSEIDNVGYGVIFEITPAGAFRTLHLFNVTDGAYPYAPPILASDGNFYGTCSTGGRYNLGTLYRMKPNGSLTILHHFGGNASDGINPNTRLIQGADGRLYGSTSRSYQANGQPSGTVFAMDLTGKYSKLYDFYGSGLSFPLGFLQASDGTLYGNASDTAGGQGWIFQLSTSGQLLATFQPNASTDLSPWALTQGLDGKLYGTTTGNPVENGAFPGPYGSIYTLDAGLPPPPPQVITFSPTSGKPGTIIGIAGNYLFNITSLQFNGVSATFHRNAPGFMTATVPAGATTGPISITNKTGQTATSSQSFTVQ